MEDRHVTLLRATLHILREAEHGPLVKDVFSCSAVWDDAECDGLCLMEEIKEWLEEHGHDPGKTKRETEEEDAREQRRAARIKARGG